MTGHQENTINLKDKGFTTEKSLGDFLRHSFGPNIKIESQKALSGYLVDFYIPEHNLVVEYDGDGHFARPDTFYNDRIREIDLKEDHDVKIIRFPYFFQLNKTVANLLFGEYFFTNEDYIDYPMFYRWKGVILPAQFCREGASYEQDLILSLFNVELKYSEEYYTTLTNWAIKKNSILRVFNLAHYNFLYELLHYDSPVSFCDNLDCRLIVENAQLDKFRRELDIMKRYR